MPLSSSYPPRTMAHNYQPQGPYPLEDHDNRHSDEDSLCSLSVKGVRLLQQQLRTLKRHQYTEWLPVVILQETRGMPNPEECSKYWGGVHCEDGYRKSFFSQSFYFPDGSCIAADHHGDHHHHHSHPHRSGSTSKNDHGNNTNNSEEKSELYFIHNETYCAFLKQKRLQQPANDKAKTSVNLVLQVRQRQQQQYRGNELVTTTPVLWIVLALLLFWWFCSGKKGKVKRLEDTL